MNYNKDTELKQTPFNPDMRVENESDPRRLLDDASRAVTILPTIGTIESIIDSALSTACALSNCIGVDLTDIIGDTLMPFENCSPHNLREDLVLLDAKSSAIMQILGRLYKMLGADPEKRQ